VIPTESESRVRLSPSTGVTVRISQCRAGQADKPLSIQQVKLMPARGRALRLMIAAAGAGPDVGATPGTAAGHCGDGLTCYFF
jgi:hypothetical protein